MLQLALTAKIESVGKIGEDIAKIRQAVQDSRALESLNAALDAEGFKRMTFFVEMYPLPNGI